MVSNPTDADMAPSQLVGDLISAHASLGREQQLAPVPAQLFAIRSVPAIAPGETAELRCEVQLPLNRVIPLERGQARFLVPLLRLAHVAADGTWQRLVLTVGTESESGVAPLRLDTGSQTFGQLGARVVESSRHMPLDPVRATG